MPIPKKSIINARNEKLKKWMYGQMMTNKVTKKDLAEILAVHPNTISNKFRNMDFNYFELVTIFKYLKADNDSIMQLMK